jgi:hypothetical protein
MEPPIVAGHMEELRFWKRQQWAVTAYAIALIAGAFHMSQSLKPLARWEKAVAMIIAFLRRGWEWMVDLASARKSWADAIGS